MSSGFTGLICRVYATQGSVFKPRTVTITVVEAYDTPTCCTAKEWTWNTFYFPSVFRARLFTKRFNEGQENRYSWLKDTQPCVKHPITIKPQRTIYVRC